MGDNMIKRILILLILVVLLNIIILIREDKISSAFNYIDDNVIDTKGDYNIYNITFDRINLNTLNFIDFFKDLNGKILGIYPKINSLYADKLTNEINYYAFNTNNSISYNLNNFTNFYKSILDDYGFDNDIEKIHFNGIKIDKVKMYTTFDMINQFIIKYPNITYD